MSPDSRLREGEGARAEKRPDGVLAQSRLAKGAPRSYLEDVSRKGRVRIVHRNDETRVFIPAVSMDGEGGPNARVGSSLRSVFRLCVFRTRARSRACETFAAFSCENAPLLWRSFARAPDFESALSRERASALLRERVMSGVAQSGRGSISQGFDARVRRLRPSVRVLQRGRGRCFEASASRADFPPRRVGTVPVLTTHLRAAPSRRLCASFGPKA